MKRVIYLFLFMYISFPLVSQTSYQTIIPLNWQLGYHANSGNGELRWIKAIVPGALQLDIASAENYGKWYFAESSRILVAQKTFFQSIISQLHARPFRHDSVFSGIISFQPFSGS